MEFATIKGFKDILPHDTALWQELEFSARRILNVFGFQEIRTPLLERTELFSRGIGQETDIVSKEMYTLQDSKGRGLTLRPEATASVVRAYIQHSLYNDNAIQKLFTIGPMFRHERPQKGRFRQFHQINAEFFGDPGPKSDTDLIVMAMSILDAIGLDGLTLHLNSLGCPDCRPGFRETLSTFLERKTDLLCEDCQRRSKTNPLRVFDCKVEGCHQAMVNAPSVIQFLCTDCRNHFEGVQDFLRVLDIDFVLDPQLVRGLDYYTRTAFEIQTDRLGAQNAVAGGGRYDGLVRLLGGPDHPAIGFALGAERVVSLMEEDRVKEAKRPDLFVAALGEKAEKICFKWVTELRRSGFTAEMEYGSKGLKAQMKRAGRLGAAKVLIVGEDELAANKGILRNMDTKGQETVALEDPIAELGKVLQGDER
ncbi:MAG: histidine--tRNA ligase [Desulfatiglans sp.]|nr:histidine--tRNA ligase [Thermodesulfobacteriota bacterium]MEE4351497.1 histidine--tRNA ligase [Desulfatiglans sp.]